MSNIFIYVFNNLQHFDLCIDIAVHGYLSVCCWVNSTYAIIYSRSSLMKFFVDHKIVSLKNEIYKYYQLHSKLEHYHDFAVGRQGR